MAGMREWTRETAIMHSLERISQMLVEHRMSAEWNATGNLRVAFRQAPRGPGHSSIRVSSKYFQSNSLNGQVFGVFGSQ